MQDVNGLDNLSPQEREFAESLSALRPVAPKLDRDAVMYAAGRASVKARRVWPWQAATGMAVGFAVAMGMMLPFRGGEVVETRVVAVVPAARVEASLPLFAAEARSTKGDVDDSYLRTRQSVLTLGMAGLQTSGNSSGGAGDDTRAISAWQVNAYLHQGAE